MVCKNCGRGIMLDPKSKMLVHTGYADWYFLNIKSFMEVVPERSREFYQLVEYYKVINEQVHGVSCLPEFSRYCFALKAEFYDGHSELYMRLLAVQKRKLGFKFDLDIEAFAIQKVRLYSKGNGWKFPMKSEICVGLEKIEYRLMSGNNCVSVLEWEPMEFPKYGDLVKQIDEALDFDKIIELVSKWYGL